MKYNQYLIQSLMFRQYVNDLQIKQLINKCLNADSSRTERLNESQISNEMITEVIRECNQTLRTYKMQISRGRNETDGTLYYALINNSDNEISRQSNEWTNKEILYLRKLISAIIESEHSFISSTKALNIGREEGINISMTSAEKLIERWIQYKWFEDINDGNIAIGIRTLLELNVYIRENFEVEDCFRCKLLCIRGSNCINCETKLHFHCVDSQFIRNNKCPNCGKHWAHEEMFATNSTSISNEVIESSERSISITDEEEDEDQNNVSVGVQRPKRSKRK